MKEHLFDTNALVQLARGGRIGERLVQSLGLDSGTPLLASSISLGEVAFFGQSQAWSQNTMAMLGKLLRNAILVDPSDGDVAKAYAQVQWFSRVGLKPSNPASDKRRMDRGQRTCL